VPLRFAKVERSLRSVTVAVTRALETHALVPASLGFGQQDAGATLRFAQFVWHAAEIPLAPFRLCAVVRGCLVRPLAFVVSILSSDPFLRLPLSAPFCCDPGEAAEQIAGIIPVGRVGTAEHVAAAVLYLRSDDAKFTVGTSLVVDGGLIAG
jgi:Enoyl-(Acyl carrier protein) reductase